MSLEKRIEELTLAVVALTAAMQNKPAPSPTPVAAEPPSSPAKAEAAEQAPTQAANDVSYEDVRRAIVNFNVKNGREATLKKLAEFGAQTGKDLKPNQYSRALEAFRAAA